MIRRPPRSTRFPDTTLFRSEARTTASLSHPGIANVFDYGEVTGAADGSAGIPVAYLVMEHVDGEPLSAQLARSEEHTSELQSCQYLVCRLLLEKKNTLLLLT